MDLSNEELQASLKSLDTRLRKVEDLLNIAPPSTWTEETITPRPPSDMPFSQVKAGTWLGVIAVICFILAAGFIVKLSIESGWLNHTKQMGLSTLLGFVLIVSGFVLSRNDREYASLLPASGIIILFTTVFGAHRYYELISFHAALIATGAVSVICVLLYLKFKYQIYPIIAAVGAYANPVFFQFNETAIFTLYYFVVCSIAFSIISIWFESRLLTLFAAYLAIILTTYVGMDLHQDQLIVYLLAANFVIFSMGTYLYSRRNGSLTSGEAWSFLPVLLIFYAAEYLFVHRINPQIAPWISLTCAGFIIILYQLSKRWSDNRVSNSWPAIVAFVTVIALHSIYLELLPENIRPWLFVVIALSFAFLPKTFFSQKSKIDYLIPILALIGIIFIEYLNMLEHLIKQYNTLWLLVSMSAFASLWLVVIVKKTVVSKRTDFNYLLLSSAHLLGIVGLYRLADPHGSLAVSASWLLYAVCVMLYAFYERDKVMANSALFILAFAAGKALLYDVSSANTSIRILCLLLTGLVLYGAGLLMRKIAAWKD